MYTIQVNGQTDFRLEIKNTQVLLDGIPLAIDLQQVDKNSFHIIHNNRSFNAEVISFDPANKSFSIKVNGNLYEGTIHDKYDQLLHELGFDKILSNKIAEIKAPMPGMVLRLLVTEGQEVKKGDSLLILEAMKMENSIKAAADVRIKSLKVKAGEKVEKNQVLIVVE
ncbi:acetyl-CoA carboxylase biotin carboxyl carrier protein subunit [Rubrolithibacter danxiaensis]|uniref:acetyl-CoA carboxylase biotin carboxyl carrier protein subunit n=1 Tax=Rubrolithibacter danxiaensis TaxID=3390805 RepID=UPI003BF8F050